jgi:hypothetical protein
MTPLFGEHEFKSANEKHSFWRETGLVSKCASLATSTSSDYQVEARYVGLVVNEIDGPPYGYERVPFSSFFIFSWKHRTGVRAHVIMYCRYSSTLQNYW